MNIMGTLRKLGIFRSGAVRGTYHNAKERPTELMMDSVYDANKDLVYGSGKDQKNSTTNKSQNNKPKWPLWLLAILGVIIILASLSAGNIWFLVIALIWVVIIIGYIKFVPAMGTLYFGFIIFSVILWITLLFLMPLGDSDADNSSGGYKALSVSEMKQYDDKTFDITSDSNELTGKVSLSYTEGKKSPYLTAKYIIQIKSNLTANGNCGTTANGCGPVIAYEYANDLVIPDDLGDSEGSLSTAYCHFGEYPNDFSDGQYYSREVCGAPNNANFSPTDKFVATFSRTTRSIEELKSWTQFDLYDAANYWVQEDTDTSTIDTDAAVQGGIKVRTYSIAYQ